MKVQYLASSSTKRPCFEEKVLILAGSSTNRGCFEDESAVFGKFLHEKALF